MKLTNKIKNNILGFIIGGIIFGSISITIASQILATQVSYSNEKSEANVTSVDGALTELYGLAEQCQNASSNGYKGKDAVAVYLDPTGIETNCSSSNFTSTTETKSGCMRFFVYAEDVEYKYAILDHNTTANGLTFYIAQSQVKEDTASWNPNYQARNISAMEIYKITESTNNQTNWQLNGGTYFYFNQKNGSNGQGYGWLFDMTRNCTSYGCTTNENNKYNNVFVYGYWTSDFRGSSQWYVKNDGCMDHIGSPTYGVRPVIQIAK